MSSPARAGAFSMAIAPEHTLDHRDSTAFAHSLRGLLHNGVMVMIVLTGLANATNYASNIVFSRILTPAGFGDMTALLALAVILTVPTAAAQTVIAERVAVHHATGQFDRLRYLVRHALAHFTVIAAIVSVVYVVAIPLVVQVLDLPHAGPAIALIPLLALAFLQPLALGVLQGLDRFAAVGMMLFAVAAARIAFGVPWVETAAGGAGGALAGQGLGVAVVLAISAWLLRDYVLPRGSGAATSGLRRKPDVRAVSASAAFVAFAVISNLDLLLAKIFLSAHEVGVYAAIATVGKLVTFLPLAVAIVMVPNVARARHTAGESARVLRVAALLVVGTALVTAVPAALAPGPVISVMFGPGYEAARDGVLPIVLAGAGVAILYLLVVYSVAIHDRRWFLVLFIGVAFQAAGIAAFHSSPAQVALMQACAIVGVLLINERWFHSIVTPLRRGRP